MKLQLVWQLAVVITALILGTILGSYYFQRVNSFAQFMSEALPTKLMTNDQPYRAIEAFCLHGIDSTREGHFDESSTMTIKDITKALNEDFSKIAEYSEKDRRKLPRDLHWSGDSYLARVLTGADSTRYYFQPAFSFEGPRELLAATDSVRIDSLLIHNPRIATNLACATASLPTLEKLLNKTIDHQIIVQCYFMAQSGTLLILGRPGVDHQMLGYLKQFPEQKYFPARPYFWGARDSRNSHGEFHYASVPYIDFGGNGVVRTYCIGLELPGGGWGIIGMDCKVEGGQQHILSQLSRISEQCLTFNVSDSSGKLTLPHDEQNKLLDTSARRWIESRIGDANAVKHASEFTGQISSINISSGAEPELYFSIPTGRDENDPHSTSFILAKVDSGALRRLWWVAGMGLILIAMFAVGLGLMLSQYFSTRVEQQSLLMRFSEVMNSSETPFVWLNELNEFEKLNLSFAKLLGYSDIADLQCQGNRKRTFIELVRESEAYHQMLLRSERGKSTGPQWWTVRTKLNGWIRIRTHGEGIRVRSITRKDQLHRFGIVMEWEPLNDKVST